MTKVAIVTGAGQGIGHAVALRLAREGLAVGALDVVAANAERTAREVAEAGGRAVALTCDVAEAASVDRAVSRCERELGPVDAIANVAGIYGQHLLIREQTLDNWRRVLDVNLTGTFLCAKRVLPAMLERRWGRIVNVASGNALSGRPKVAPYSASKMAVIGFTKALALEAARSGVTVNAVMPGITDTAMPRENDPEGKRIPMLAERNPMGRIGQPEDLANAIAFLVSDDAGYITGQTIAVNGGIRELP